MEAINAGDSDDIEQVQVELIRDGYSPRLAGASAEHVRLLAELDVRLPPITVHRATMKLIDGAHRLAAAKLRGRATIDVRFFDGTEEEAFVEGVRANIAHGLPLTLTDRKAAAARLLRTHGEWSDRLIARMIGLSPKTVGAVRRSIEEIPQLTARIGRDGRTRTTPAVRRPRAPEPRREGETVFLETESPQGAAELKRLYDPLRQDPSVRMTEAGRFLLRLLDLHLVCGPDWTRVPDTIPPHHMESVAQLAGECSRMWLSLADHVARRGKLPNNRH